ncbi:MAG: DUF1553 domain-containing protein [Planctomycetaceae bacterium]|nr:MAG: DUF1553 domain-containing protein [Planctomycetaceae bacterium]
MAAIRNWRTNFSRGVEPSGGKSRPTFRLLVVLVGVLGWSAGGLSETGFLGSVGSVIADEPRGTEQAIATIRDGATESSGAVDFERDITPIVARHCLDCHGPDGAESDLRLDTMLGFLRGGDSGERSIVPGASDRSYLISRVTAEDAGERMPPDGTGLDDAELAILKAWIDDAAAWSEAEASLASSTIDHWSFRPLAQSLPPADGELSEVSHPIDAFLRQRLIDSGLSWSPPAGRRTLIRRLHLVMHGLPPTPATVAEWLDVAGGDGSGAVADRDWEQWVDGVLASPRYGERFATMWLDLVRFGETNGFETNRERPHAWRYRDWVIEAFNSDLPYDRFVFEQLAGDAVGADVATGFLVAGPYDLVKGQDELLQLTQRQDELADMINTAGTAFLGLTLGCARCHNHKFDPVTQSDYYALQAVFAGVQHGDRELPPDPQRAGHLERIDRELAEVKAELSRYRRLARVPRTSEDGDSSDGEPSDGESAALREPVNARHNIDAFPPTDVRFVRFTILATNQGEPCLDELEVYSDGENVALASAGGIASSSGDFVHPLHKLEHVNDGRHGNSRSWIASQLSGGWVQIELPEVRPVDEIHWGRDREGRFADRLAIDYRIEGSLDGEEWELLATSADREPADPSRPPVPVYDFDAFPPDEAAQGRGWLQRLERLTAERDEVARSELAYAGTFHQPGPVHRLYRGEPTAPREQVAPGAIGVLTDLGLSADAPEQQRRVALAHWIASPDNPLTARVIANRVWQFHFGFGLVDTPSDFGGNGVQPTHPELLDWLATELIRSGWSLKHLHRLILTSRAWRQAGHPNPEALAVDAGSRLLWRFPPRRLEAEAIRDSLLAVAGTLEPAIGGPGFSSFEVALENVRHYFPKQSFGPEDWRRMVYMTRVRQERDAIFGVFDCPDFNQVVPKRGSSTTPLQALNLLNSPFVLEQAERLAGRLEREEPDLRRRVALAYELVFSRLPDDVEIDEALELVEAVSWSAFARALFNANEFLLIP